MEAKKSKGTGMPQAGREYARREHTNLEAARAGKPTDPPTHDQNAIHQERMRVVREYRNAYLSECARLDHSHDVA